MWDPISPWPLHHGPMGAHGTVCALLFSKDNATRAQPPAGTAQESAIRVVLNALLHVAVSPCVCVSKGATKQKYNRKKTTKGIPNLNVKYKHRQ